jgi:hypothetical protein
VTLAKRPSAVSLALSLVLAGLAIVIAAPPAAATVFSNATAITVPDATCGSQGKASAYPWNIAVSGLTGTISDVNVTLTGINTPWEADLELLLVGPGGQNLLLLSDAGSGAFTGNVTFDDSAAGLAPQNSAWPAGTYKPTNYTESLNNGGADPFPAPAPTPSSTTTLGAAFNGGAPNGTWSLYVIDDACSAPDPAHTIAGWSLDLSTSAGAATTTSVISSLNPSTTGSNVTFTATVTSGGPVAEGTVTFTEGVTTLAANVAVNASGQASFSKSNFAEGNHIVTATYNGTASFATSNGSVNQRVNNATTVTGSTYCNTGAIAVNAATTATPYPSNIAVSGFSSSLGKITVTLKNVTHQFPDDIDALLVGPTGTNLVVLSDAGNPGGPTGSGASNVTVNFDDAAAGQLAQNTPWGAAGSTVASKPVDYDPAAQVDVFTAPAPAPSAATALSTFNLTNPNGTWALYVMSDGAPDTGTIAGGWCINLTSAKLDPTLSTSASNATIGSAISDTATVSGTGATPTGTVVFTAFTTGDCSGTAAFTSGAITLAGGPPPTATGSFTPTAPGTYNWIATYGGDTNYNTKAGPCLATGETSTVNKATATISTSATAATVLGGAISDTATVTGAASPTPAPTGTIGFTAFNNSSCIGPAVFSSPGRPLGGGPPATATSTAFTPPNAGSYYWIAAYSGDANYNVDPGACNGLNETSAVAKATPTIATMATANSSVGGATSDTATVTGAASPAAAPTGTVTFTAFTTGDCSGTAAFTSAAIPLAGGPPPTANSGTFNPTAPGTYNWVAAYSGDTNYNSVTGACLAANESSVIGKATPTLATSATSAAFGAAVSDTATVTGAASPAPAPTGTVTFTAFANTSCTGTPAFTSAAIPLAGGPPPTANSGAFIPPAVATYNWIAAYSGDTNYTAVTGTCLASGETSTMTKATPTITTSATPSVILGNAIADTATVTGAASPAAAPTGTVTFTLFNNAGCTGSAYDTWANQPLAGGPPPTAISGGTLPTVAGAYYWIATYNGDTNYNTVSGLCGDAGETSVITKASATIATSATPTAVLGNPISDTATVTGAASAPTPTGTVTFTAFTNTSCTGTPAFTSTPMTLAGGPPPTANSGPFSPPAAATYNWIASYSGDGNYNAVSGACLATNETSTVTKATPSITTQATSTAPAGGSISDTATVTGAATPAAAPTGTVTFTAFTNTGCTGTPAFTSAAIALAGGPPPTANSGPFSPATAGSYNWVAAYSGDTNYNAVTGNCLAANETSTVTKASPTITTQASAGGPVGTTVTDTATIAGGASPTGSVVFRLFTSNTCTTEVFTSTNSLTVLSATSGGFKPANIGTYYWTAVYGGDNNNNSATSPCNALNESVTITKASPTISTQASPGGPLGTAVTDTATLAGGLNPTGTVTFRLYSDSVCNTQVNPTSVKTLAGASVTSDSYTPTALGTYYWTAVYSGDTNHNSAMSGCGAPNESVAITCTPLTGTVSGNLNVTSGAVCLSNATVTGNITVAPGASITITNSTVKGSITSDGATSFTMCGSSVTGSVAIQNTTGFVLVGGDGQGGCAANSIGGSLTLTSNKGGLRIAGNSIGTSLTVTNNTVTGGVDPIGGAARTVIRANFIKTTFACSGNSPVASNDGVANYARGARSGECASPAF